MGLRSSTALEWDAVSERVQNVQDAGNVGWNITLPVPSLVRQLPAPTLWNRFHYQLIKRGSAEYLPAVTARKQDGAPSGTKLGEHSTYPSRVINRHLFDVNLTCDEGKCPIQSARHHRTTY